MKLISILIFLCVNLYSPEEKVYICFSKGASRYHFKEHCKGLASCKHVIKKVTVEEARQFGLTLCRWED